MRGDDDNEDEGDSEEVAVLEIDGVLDLHTFAPKEIKTLIPDYIEECLARGITEIRIIHGKGIGNLRRLVHSILDKHPKVVGYRLCSQISGGWGATEADLKPNVKDDGTLG
jgi:dsDNA-specific endonuclease/ATPase MutS2